MAAFKGLGKGLGALLSDSEEEYDLSFKDSGKESVGENPSADISLSKIEPNSNQPRKSFDEVALAELANSIRIHGVISPIIVVKKKNSDNYMIIAGERRYRAAKKAGLLSIPAIVRDYTDKQIQEISLIENLQREDLNPIETATAIKELMDEHRYTQEQVAERIGKSRPAVTNILRLLNLTPPVKDMVANGNLSTGHARCLVVVNSESDQLQLAKLGADNKTTVREFEKIVKNYLSPKKDKPKAEQSLELKELVSRIQKSFETKVSVLGNDNKGRIYIDYYTRDDLDRLTDIIDIVEKYYSKG